MIRYRLHWIDGTYTDVVAHNLTEALDMVSGGPNEWKMLFYEENPTCLFQEMARSLRELFDNTKINAIRRDISRLLVPGK